MVKTTRGSKATAANGGKEDDDDTPMDDNAAVVDIITVASASGDAFMDDGGEGKPPARPKTARKRRRPLDDDNKESMNNNSEQQERKLKRTRLLSPDPSPKTLKDAKMAGTEEDEEVDSEEDEREENDSEMEDQEHKEGDASVGAAVATAPAGSGGSEGVEDVAHQSLKPAAGKASLSQRAQKLRLPSQQTPGKFASQEMTRPSDLTLDQPTNEIPVPSRRLVFNSTPTAAAAASEHQQNLLQQDIMPAAKAKANGSSDSGAPHPVQLTVEPPPPQQQQDSRNDMLAKPLVWVIVILALHMACYPLFLKPLLPKVVNTSTRFLHFYKGVYYRHVPPPKKRVVNQTFVDELKGAALKRQQEKRKMLKELKETQKALKEEIEKMKMDARSMDKDLELVEQRVKNHKEPLVKLHDKLSRIENLLQEKASGNLNYTRKALPEIRNALGQLDKNKLLDLSALDLWAIPEMPEDCGINVTEYLSLPNSTEESEVELTPLVVNVVEKDRLDKWLAELEEHVNNSTDEILKSDDVAKQVKKWIRSEIKDIVDWDKTLANFTVEELGKLIKKVEENVQVVAKEEGNSLVGNSLMADAILLQIQQRLEIEIADQTGRFDYALIRNGAVVIREGPHATSLSLVQTMPFFNRLLAHVGLRFYGHGAEAALTPTDPPDALGQCWSFLSEDTLAKKRRKPRSAQDFTRGSVATLAVRLARPAYVHSVVIEHPPTEITDRIQSAIRVFRVVGYEDAFAQHGSFELGRFEYKIDGENTRKEFPVARKLSRVNVPKLQSVTLAIESTWGGSDDYGCLYRFRVHGDDNE